MLSQLSGSSPCPALVQDSLLMSLMHWLAMVLLKVVPARQVAPEQPTAASPAVMHSSTVVVPRRLQEEALLHAAVMPELQAATGLLVSAPPQPAKANTRQTAASKRCMAAPFFREPERGSTLVPGPSFVSPVWR
jgi:hypothetical protein